MTLRPFGLFGVLASSLFSAIVVQAAEVASKPVLLYSRHFNARGESRYLPDGTFKEVLKRLSSSFEVRVHDKALNAQVLDGVHVVLIANPSESAVGTNPAPVHLDKQNAEILTSFVARGGGLIITGNQENHNLEIADVNQCIGRFGIRFTNNYTDAKLIAIPASTPVVGGLKWGYYTGNSLILDSTSSAKPKAMVTNDTSQIPVGGARNAPGVLMASATFGKGRVVISTDTGWMIDSAFNDVGIGSVSLKGQDNWEICHRLMLWLAGK